MLLWPIREMGRILTDMGKPWSRWDASERFSIPHRTDGSRDQIPKDSRLKGEIEFRGSVLPNTDDNHILKGIDLKIAAGETIAILGATEAVNPPLQT
jgi:ATP-binding cassette subfamily B protein